MESQGNKTKLDEPAPIKELPSEGKFLKWRKDAREYLGEYCNNTSLHGLKYVAGEKRTRLEKCLWTTLFFVAVGSCAYMVYNEYTRWENSPVIVSFAQNPTPVWEIPFPAVTICPQNKVKQRVFNYTKLFHQQETLDKDDLETLAKLSLVCDFKTINTSLFTHLKYENDTIMKFLKHAAPNYTDVFVQCIWNGARRDCSSLFQMSLNDEGICFTFNMLQPYELFTDKMHLFPSMIQNATETFGWDLEKGYASNVELNAYPRRVLGAGIESGFEILLRTTEDDLDYICKAPIQGFKVILHEAGNIPNSKTNYIHGPINQEVVIAVQPQLLTTSYNLKRYGPGKRKCYFENERKLEFFKRYTQKNCNLECFTQATLQTCGCVAIHMPKNSTTKLCGPSQINCVRTVEDKYLKTFFQQNKNNKNKKYIAACNCLPACFSLQYGAETSQAVLEMERYLEAIGRPNPAEESERNHITSLKIFFKEQQFIATERNELYGATEFLANCGGLFGLFTGFSILSLCEIIYYLTIRTWINRHLFGKYLMATPDDPDLFKKNLRIK